MFTKRLLAFALVLGPLGLAVASTAGCPGSLDLGPYEAFDGGGGKDAGKTTSASTTTTKASVTASTTSTGMGGGDAGTDSGTGGAGGMGGGT